MDEIIPATYDLQAFPDDWFDKRYMTEEDALELYGELNPEDQRRIVTGDYKLFPTREGSYPHFRWRKGNPSGMVPGTRAPNSGVSPAHRDRENGAKNTGVRNTKAYRELLAYLLPAELDSERRGSIAWLIEQALEASEGGWVTKECPQCDYEVQMYRKPDSTMIKELLHQTIGKAPSEVQHSGSTETVHKLIDERVDPGTITTVDVYRQDPNEVQRREEAIKALREKDSGVGEVIEGEFRDENPTT